MLQRHRLVGCVPVAGLWRAHQSLQLIGHSRLLGCVNGCSRMQLVDQLRDLWTTVNVGTNMRTTLQCVRTSPPHLSLDAVHCTFHGLEFGCETLRGVVGAALHNVCLKSTLKSARTCLCTHMHAHFLLHWHTVILVEGRGRRTRHGDCLRGSSAAASCGHPELRWRAARVRGGGTLRRGRSAVDVLAQRRELHARTARHGDNRHGHGQLSAFRS